MVAKRPRSILIVDDEADIQSSLSFALRDEGFETVTCSLPSEALKLLEKRTFDIGLFDVWYPEGDGIELLQETQKKFPEAVIVMMSGHGNIELALKAIRLGAYDFLEKPLELEKLLVTLKNICSALDLRDENLRLTQELRGRAQFVGSSPAAQAFKLEVERSAASSAHALILGEHGSGKDLVARLLHQNSPRAKEPFVKIVCAHLQDSSIEAELFGVQEKDSVRPGRFDEVGAGTLYLDGVAELSPAAQGKLLRVLEDRSFVRVGGQGAIRTPARILASLSKDPATLVAEGKLREDLFFRLKVLSLHVPALRDRAVDVPELAKFFLRLLAIEQGGSLADLSPELLDWLKAYEWPGNVRELRNLMERLLIMSGGRELLKVADLPEELQSLKVSPAGSLQRVVDPQGELRVIRAQFERMILEQRLERFNGNVTKTAESLGIERAHLHRKLKHYGLTGYRGES